MRSRRSSSPFTSCLPSFRSPARHQLGLDAVRYAASGSAPIPPDLIQWYRDLGLELLEGYGMSEDFAYSHATIPGKGRVGYVGSPMPGVEVKISDEGTFEFKESVCP